MLIRAGYELTFQIRGRTPMTLMLRIHPSREPDIRYQEVLIEPNVAVESFVDGFGNRCERIVAPPGQLRLWADAVLEDSGDLDAVAPYATQGPIEELPHEILPYLMNSRYCEVDKMTPIAWELFGHIQPGWPRVQAICDWVHSRIKFGYVFARNTKSAFETYVERTAVCRDFTHLAITFCRAMGIPARYVSGYLGDIGIPLLPDPMDFSAWFEVYLSGRWHTFDARHNQPRIGRILMATGRDATDIALTTSYGETLLTGFRVWTDEVTDSDQAPAVVPANASVG